MTSPTLLIFTRYPVPGQTKTRLIPALGPQGAAHLHRRLTETVLAQVQPSNLTPILVYTGGTAAQMEAWLGPDLTYWPQTSGSLGDRLIEAFQQAFDRSKSPVLAIGSDCPFITPERLHQALAHLSPRTPVLGPALDGGYYLIGLTQPRPSYFQNITWGTCTVYAQTLAQIHQTGDRPYRLPPLRDIDRPEDLAHLPPALQQEILDPKVDTPETKSV